MSPPKWNHFFCGYFVHVTKVLYTGAHWVVLAETQATIFFFKWVKKKKKKKHKKTKNTHYNQAGLQEEQKQNSTCT